MTDNPILCVMLVTGRTIEQGVGKEHGKGSADYFQSVSVCYVDSEDLKKLGVNEGSNVTISTFYGSVVVKALKSLRGPHGGVVFMPYGPWANSIVSQETDSIGMPSLKGIRAKIEPAPNKSIASLGRLLSEQFKRAGNASH